MGDFEKALTLQDTCLQLAIERGDVASQGRAYGNMGNAYSAMAVYDKVCIINSCIGRLL